MKTPKLTIELNQLAVLNKHIADIEAALGQAELDNKELTVENQRLRDGIAQLKLEGSKDYEGMRQFQEKFIKADRKSKRLREAILNMRGKMPDEDLNIWVEKAIAAAEDE